jgi:hypothetical protein
VVEVADPDDVPAGAQVADIAAAEETRTVGLSDRGGAVVVLPQQVDDAVGVKDARRPEVPKRERAALLGCDIPCECQKKS